MRVVFHRVVALLVVLFTAVTGCQAADTCPDRTPADDKPCCVAQKSMELLKDRHFRTGFSIKSTQHGNHVPVGEIRTDDKVEPQWYLAQWHSKNNILKGTVERVGEKGFIIKDPTKKVTLGLHDADLTLYMNSVPEYKDVLRKEAQPWPHLLVEQKITTCPSLAELKALNFQITAKILKSKTFRKDGYTKVLHTAHIPYVLVIQNINKQSAGYGDFLWFLVPIYDDRYEFAQPFIAQDIADPSAKMIYDPGARRYTNESLHSGQWVTIKSDLLPVIKDAFQAAWERGYLKDSRDLADYSISSMNLGWEITGLNEAHIAIKDLSLQAVVVDQKPAK